MFQIVLYLVSVIG